MDERLILAFLRYPSAPLVDFGMTLANLTWQEQLALELCGRKHMTQERAAEQAGYSVDAVQKWYRSGMKKLGVVWDGQAWIKKILD